MTVYLEGSSLLAEGIRQQSSSSWPKERIYWKVVENESRESSKVGRSWRILCAGRYEESKKFEEKWHNLHVSMGVKVTWLSERLNLCSDFRVLVSLGQSFTISALFTFRAGQFLLWGPVPCIVACRAPLDISNIPVPIPDSCISLQTLSEVSWGTGLPPSWEQLL